MRCLSRYIFRQIAVLTLFVAVVLTLAIWLSQSLRFFDVVINRGLPLDMAAWFLTLLMPSLLTIVLPVALFIAICFVYNKLGGDSEVVVMRAAGCGNLALARPALLFGVIVSALGLALTLYAMPASFRAFKDLHRAIRDNHAQTLLEAGVFTEVTKGVTVFVRARNAEGGLRGVLLQDERDRQKTVTYTAVRGLLTSIDDEPRVLLEDGTYQEIKRAGGGSSILYFDRVVVGLGEFGGSRRTVRDARERFLSELLHPPRKTTPQQRTELLAEAHQRLSLPLYCFAFAAVGAALLLTGDLQRRGRPWRIGAAVLAIVVLQFGNFGLHNMTAGDARFAPWIYALPLLAILVSLMALAGLGSRWSRRLTPLRPGAAPQVRPA